MTADKKKGLSRRGFLQGSATATLGAATGGASATAASAISVASSTGTITAAVTAARSVREMSDILHGVYGSNVLSSETIKGIQSRIFGQAKPKIFGPEDDNEYKSHDPAYQNEGKFDCKEEEKLFWLLKKFPGDAPMSDLIGNEMLSELGDGFKGHEKLNALKEFVAPLLKQNSNANVQDALNQFQGFFKKLADEAMKNPDKFLFSSRSGCGHIDYGRYDTSIHQIHEILETYKGSDKEFLSKLNNVAEGYKNKNYQLSREWKKQRDQKLWAEEMAESKKKREEEIAEAHREEREHLEALEHKRNNPKLRTERNVTLMSLGDGQSYGVQVGEYDAMGPRNMPTKMDWIHFLQANMDGDVKPSDISVEDLGARIVFHSSEAKAHIKSQKRDYYNGNFLIALPNRRMHVDLNQYRTEYDYGSNMKIINEIPSWNVISLNPNASSTIENHDIYAEKRMMDLKPSDVDVKVDVHYGGMDVLEHILGHNIYVFTNDRGNKIDGLTGIYNRAGLVDILGQKYAIAGNDVLLTAITVDVKHMNHINDVHGHMDGDEVLRDVASKLKIMYDDDALAIARIGGDKMIVVLQGNKQCDDLNTQVTIRKAMRQILLESRQLTA